MFECAKFHPLPISIEKALTGLNVDLVSYIEMVVVFPNVLVLFCFPPDLSGFVPDIIGDFNICR